MQFRQITSFHEQLSFFCYLFFSNSATTLPFSSSWGHSKMYTPGTIANSQTERVPTKINKNGAVVKVYKNFSGTKDALRHLKTFRVISTEMPLLLLISSWCYFSCLKMYSDKFFNPDFYKQMFFKLFMVKRDTG